MEAIEIKIYALNWKLSESSKVKLVSVGLDERSYDEVY